MFSFSYSKVHDGKFMKLACGRLCLDDGLYNVPDFSFFQ